MCPPVSQKTFRGFCPCKFLTKNTQEKHARRAGGGAAGEPGFPAITITYGALGYVP